MNSILELTATQARSALQNKDFTATELTTAYLQAADATSSLNNYVCMTADKALEMAAERWKVDHWKLRCHCRSGRTRSR